MYRGPIFFPLVLVVLGFLLLFSNLGYIQFDFWKFIETWWPLLLIIFGLDLLIGSLRAQRQAPRPRARSGPGPAGRGLDQLWRGRSDDWQGRPRQDRRRHIRRRGALRCQA